MKLRFKNELIEGLIRSRPNRFIMLVDLEGKLIKCHCPSTGRIGNIVFRDIPCLLSRADNPERKTPFTVEAISLDPPGKKNKSWIGINQNAANRYVEFFLRTGQLDNMLVLGNEQILREQKLGESRIDFQVGKDYLEVKTPLISLPQAENGISTRRHPRFNSFDRLIRHFRDLTSNLGPGSRAILLMCYLYDAEPFRPPRTDSKNSRIKRAASRAFRKGVEHWQANLKVSRKGVELIGCFRL